ncbi:MAG TPA: hypothetical protein VIM35_08985 [Gallionella sp.]
MKNSIDVHIEFSFKGETYALTSNIDLDQIMENGSSFPAFHAILARDNKIDTYSYLYEVMLETGIRFANAQGIAADFLSGGDFNQEGFISAWQENRILGLLQPIATRELGITNLNQHQSLKIALVQAYSLGKRTC